MHFRRLSLTCRWQHAAAAQQTVVTPALPPEGGAHANPTVRRRKALFTYTGNNTAEANRQQSQAKPVKLFPAHINQCGSSGSQKEQRTALQQAQAVHYVQQQQPLWQQEQQFRRQQQQKQQQQFPDPAADDVDMLVLQASGAATNPNTTGSRTTGTHGTIISIPAGPSKPAVVVPAGRKPRYTARDKLYLTKEAAQDVARRLRQAGPPQLRQPQLRVFRYGIDDLRLYKALDLAGLEGRVVVVDSVDFADAVLTARKKRTGKAVNLGVARRTAKAAGLPLFELQAVSAQRILEALGPMLRLAAVVEQYGPFSGQQQASRAAAAAEYENLLQVAQSRRFQPRLMRWDEMESDGSEQLMQLLWGSLQETQAAASPSQGPLRHAAAAAAAVGTAAGVSTGSRQMESPRWRAWCAAQMPDTEATLWQLVRDSHVDDKRDCLVPANPNKRIGLRHRFARPLKHFSTVQRRNLQRDLWQKQVPW